MGFEAFTASCTGLHFFCILGKEMMGRARAKTVLRWHRVAFRRQVASMVGRVMIIYVRQQSL
jgi:hypothetical protein